MEFRVGFEVDDDLAKKIELDDRLANKIFDHASKEYKGCLSKVVGLTKFCDKRMEKKNREKVAKQWKADASRYFDEAEARMDQLARKGDRDLPRQADRHRPRGE